MDKREKQYRDKVSYFESLPIGANVYIEGVIGGRTEKVGKPFYSPYVGWKMVVRYFDMDQGPGKEYIEKISNMIVPRKDK